jgi:hypothetical protein
VAAIVVPSVLLLVEFAFSKRTVEHAEQPNVLPELLRRPLRSRYPR